MIKKDLIDKIDENKLKDLLLRLLKIPSPTGNSNEVSELFAGYMSSLGFDTELDTTVPGAPNVIALKKGTGKSNVRLSFLGHLDTIPDMGHQEPCFKDGYFYGRGACDMKSGIAAMAEMARVIAENDVMFDGDLLIATHSFHEEPVGNCQGLFNMIQNGILGNAVICTEGEMDFIPVVGKGLCVFEISVIREGESIHETQVIDESNPIMVVGRLLETIKKYNCAWAEKKYELIGSQTMFIGKVEGGDFYNRLPLNCKITGTIRFTPDKDFDDIENEIRTLISEVKTGSDTQIILKMKRTNPAFHVNNEDPIVKAVREAHREVRNIDVPDKGMIITGDAAKVNIFGKIPAIYQGIGFKYAHADIEKAALTDITVLAKVLLMTAINYLK